MSIGQILLVPLAIVVCLTVNAGAYIVGSLFVGRKA
jgi:hypothetical protein